MFGVAGAEVFFDFEVGGFPEAGEVGGDLDGFEAGGEEVKEYRGLGRWRGAGFR